MEIEFEKEKRGMTPSIKVQAASPTSDIAAGPARLLRDIGRALQEFDQESAPAASIIENKTLPPTPDDPQVIELLMKHARILMKAGESKLAFNILRNVLMRAPTHTEALRMLGLSLREAGRLEEGLKCFKALAKAASDAAGIFEGRYLVAETLYLAERDEVALAAYREILKNVIEDREKLFEIYKNIGNIHVRAGDFEAAEEFYDKAYTLNPNSDVLLINYGTLEIQRENTGAAVERFRQAVEINANNDRGWVGLAMVHRAMGDIELATANLERALDINTGNRTACRLMVEWSWTDGTFANAIRRVQDYVSAQGAEDAEMCFHLAKLFTQSGRLRDARLEMERVLALDPAIESGEALAKALDRELAKRETVGAEAN